MMNVKGQSSMISREQFISRAVGYIRIGDWVKARVCLRHATYGKKPLSGLERAEINMAVDERTKWEEER